MAGTWSRDEHLVTLDLYLNHPDIVEDSSDEEVREVAKLIERSPSAVVLRLGNYRYLDPRSTQGLSNISKECREIWEDFYGNEDELSLEADRARRRLGSRTDPPESDSGTEAREVQTGTYSGGTQRRGQSDFRAAVRERYDDTCLLCDVGRLGLLQAGHILPWGEFEEPRGDVDNGILLCYTHHRAFDLELFTITEADEVVTRPDVSDVGSFLKRTLVNVDSVTFPKEPPSREYLRRRNERLQWWSPEE